MAAGQRVRDAGGQWRRRIMVLHAVGRVGLTIIDTGIGTAYGDLSADDIHLVGGGQGKRTGGNVAAVRGKDKSVASVDKTGCPPTAKSAGLPIAEQKQAGHIPGTPQYANRIRQGKTTSAFFGEKSGNEWTQRAWREGTPTADPKIKIYDAGVSVGTGPNGGMQTQVRVSIDSQGRIHGTPWGPEK